MWLWDECGFMAERHGRGEGGCRAVIEINRQMKRVDDHPHSTPRVLSPVSSLTSRTFISARHLRMQRQCGHLLQRWFDRTRRWYGLSSARPTRVRTASYIHFSSSFSASAATCCSAGAIVARVARVRPGFSLSLTHARSHCVAHPFLIVVQR